jgi:hypothetical protein
LEAGVGLCGNGIIKISIQNLRLKSENFIAKISKIDVLINPPKE